MISMQKSLPWLVMAWLGMGAASRAGDAPAFRELRVATSTAGVIVGHAKLTVDALLPPAGGGDGLSGGYRVDVTPVPIGSEAGKLSIAVKAAELRRLAAGAAVQFTGKAVSKEGKNSRVSGTATPSGTDGGKLEIEVADYRGKLLFKTSYRLVR